MMKLAPYPEYKDAGVSWVGSIPAHWPEKRAKYYFKEIDERSQTGDEEMLSVSHITGVTPRSQKNVSMFKAESNVGQKRCQPGDIVINTMWAWMSALGVSNDDGIVSPAYGVYRPRSNQDYDNYYLDHLLRIGKYRSEYICRSTGIRSSRLRLYPDKFLRMRVACPPLDEQKTIARFLKAQDRLFRKFIRNKRRLIELLKEQKQNVINQAVTRGLDLEVRLKPSGVEWIGDIPVHWEVRKAKHLCEKIIDCKNRTPPDGKEDEYRVVRTSDVKDGKLINDEITWTTEEGYKIWTQRGAPQVGDVFFTREAPCGEACIVPEDMELCMGQRMMYFRPDSELLDKEYLLFSIYGPIVRDYISINTNGSTVGHLRLGQVYSLPIAWCPVEEQKAIVTFIKYASVMIDAAITRAQRDIELIREYRTRLISDVVTGQVDVRGIEVPDVAEHELLALVEDSKGADEIIDDELEMEVEE
ncbi:MAG: restriction endonuclease subunit S [Candidatus Thiodiazotropha sp.]|nr:restriction endonuclease subunit S [Candidatus Thiodiazotropha sp.]